MDREGGREPDHRCEMNDAGTIERTGSTERSGGRRHDAGEHPEVWSSGAVSHIDVGGDAGVRGRPLSVERPTPDAD
jgi:hypothetical protein